MRPPVPALLPLFRSQTQLDLLAAVYGAPDDLSVSDLAQRIAAPLSTVSREVGRLAEAGVVTVLDQGRARLVRARRDFAWGPALAELLDRAVGVTATLERELARVAGVESGWVHGSWARRANGRLGPPPPEVAVAVVGRPDGGDLRTATSAVEAATGVRVALSVFSRHAWAVGDDPAVRAVKDGPVTPLDLGVHEVER